MKKRVRGKSIPVFPSGKRGVSAIIATVFLIMITVAAVAIIWGTVIPFIKGNLDLNQRQVELTIVTGTGYTLYDPEQKMAFVQVGRGSDNVTLHGMELMIDFDGTTYQTTLRAPNPSQDKKYFFDMTSMPDGLLPRTISVAPVFILDARQVLGQITSKVNMPILNIVKNYTDIIIELQEEDNDIAFVNLTEGNTTMTNLCDSYTGEDPWGGCPIAAGDIYKVSKTTSFKIYSKQNVSASWYSSPTVHDWIKVMGGDCVNSTYSGACINITNAYVGPIDYDDYISISTADSGVVNVVTTCTGNNWYYIYDNAQCE